jgi:hypothetical protein
MASIKGACWNEMKLILSSLLHLALGYIWSLWLANISTSTSFLLLLEIRKNCRLQIFV